MINLVSTLSNAFQFFGVFKVIFIDKKWFYMNKTT
jgi:hypothetical protein